jgi:hypothetical protein
VTKAQRRPMAKVRSVALVTREITERLSLAGAELLLSAATKLSEGQLMADGSYFGSTMLTIDLDGIDTAALCRTSSAGKLSRSGEMAAALRLTRLMGRHDAFVDRVKAIAHQDAVKLADEQLATPQLDVRIRAEARLVFIDVDIEATAAEKPKRATHQALSS